MLITTGLRIGDATGLRWEDIDLDAGQLSVRKTVKWIEGEGLVLADDAKTERSHRRIDLAPGTVKALRIHEKEQEWEKRVAGKKWQGRGLVFCTETGGLLDRKSVMRWKDQALESCGLPRVRTHDLRHTAATYLLTTGTPAKVVQELLGHSTITLTMDTYSHVLPTMQKQVAADMDRLFSVGAEAV